MLKLLLIVLLILTLASIFLLIFSVAVVMTSLAIEALTGDDLAEWLSKKCGKKDK